MGKRLYSFLLRISNKFSNSAVSKIPGVKAIHRSLFKLSDPQGIILISVQGNKMYVDTRDKAIVPQLVRDGIWEEYETKLFHQIIKPGNVVVDCGANIGYFTLIAAKLAGDKGKVYSFEPEPGNFELLKKNIKVNSFSNVTPVQKALSDKKGELTLFLNNLNLGAHSIIDSDDPKRKGGSVDVKTITLDGFFEYDIKSSRVDFIKMDAEGAEGLVISGAQRILRENDLKILMEFWPSGLRKLGTDPLKMLNDLEGFGYKIKLLDDENCKMKEMENKDIIEYCDVALKGIHEVNLFLEK
jgi:FkbM family methyltransferase